MTIPKNLLENTEHRDLHQAAQDHVDAAGSFDGSHDSLTGVTSDQHHAEVHDVDGADHAFPGGAGTTYLDDTGAFTTPAGSSLEVKEVDGTPDVTGVTKIVVSNGKLTDDGSGQVTLDLSGGASGSSTADHFVVGMGGEGDTDLSNKIVIPGLSGSPDARVAGTNDDEFDQNGSGTPSGWTNISSGAADTIDTNTFKSHLHLKANAGAGTAWKGIYKTAPSLPFTMTAKFSDATSISNFNYAAIGVGAAGSTGAFAVTGIQHNNNGIYTACVTVYTNRTTVSAGVVSGGNLSARTPLYFRIVATSSTNVSYYLSYNGMFWHPINVAHNPGFTIAIVAIMVNSESAADACELYCDWVRFT